jgi:hypothetical protein
MFLSRTRLSKSFGIFSSFIISTIVVGTALVSIGYASEQFDALPADVQLKIVKLAVGVQKCPPSLSFEIKDKESYLDALSRPVSLNPIPCVCKKWHEWFQIDFPFQQISITITDEFFDFHDQKHLDLLPEGYSPAHHYNPGDPTNPRGEEKEASNVVFNKVFNNLVSKYPKVTSLKLIDTIMIPYNASNATGFLSRDYDDLSDDKKNQILRYHMRDCTPLCAMIHNPLPELASLTIDHCSLRGKRIIKKLRTNLPKLKSLTVLPPIHKCMIGFYIPQEDFKRFESGWKILGPILTELHWHGAAVSDSTATAISDFIKNNKTLKVLDLTGAQISQTGKAQIQDAASIANNIETKL